MRVALFVPCLVSEMAPRVAEATARVLARVGLEVVTPRRQTCCGQPLFNTGDRRGAASLARRMDRVFPRDVPVVTPSGSCAHMVRHHHPELAPKSTLPARTHELGAFLTDVLGLDLARLGARGAGRALTWASCHGRRVGARAETLTAAVAGVDAAPLAPGAPCCGFGGAFSLREPEIAAAVAAPLVDAVRAARPDRLLCDDVGCALHLEGACRRAGVPVDVRHPVEVLAEGLGLMPREPRITAAARGGEPS